MRDGPDAIVRAARVIVDEGGAEMVKLDTDAAGVRAVVVPAFRCGRNSARTRPTPASRRRDCSKTLAQQCSTSGIPVPSPALP